jgi:hypothetical protein
MKIDTARLGDTRKMHLTMCAADATCFVKGIEDALNKIEATSTLNAVTMLVTTRTMGFCAAQI